MPAIVDEEDDSELLMIFPLTDLDGVSRCDETSDEDESPHDLKDHHELDFKPLMTLKERRRSKLFTTGREFSNLDISSSVRERFEKHYRKDSGVELIGTVTPQMRWWKALDKIRAMKDPWEKYGITKLDDEVAVRHRYNAVTKQWVIDEIVVKIEKQPFNRGAMRTCYRLKKGVGDVANVDWKSSRNCVAKRYMEDVSREVYFEDVRLQMDAKLWGEEYSRHNPPKKVDILQMSVLELKNRDGSPLFHLENFIDGKYIKYNSNSGFVEDNVRFTPQAFSHFTFERSAHQMIVVDVQGVGDLWTDPQIHTAEGKGYGDGNLGTRGMALFFHSHICNSICVKLGLSKFDLSESEKNDRDISRMMSSPHTVIRSQEGCHCLSQCRCRFITTRSISGASSVFSEEEPPDSGISPGFGDDDPMSLDNNSPISPRMLMRRRSRKFLSDPDESAFATTTEEEERIKFQLASSMRARPSCVFSEKDLCRLAGLLRVENSVLGEIHHELAKYHEIGRFVSPGDEYDVTAAMFHEKVAADLGVKEAIVTLANIYLGIPHDVLSSVTVENSDQHVNLGVDYMLAAAEAGDRQAMIYMAKAFETGIGLDLVRKRSYHEAVTWYERAINTTEVDDSGEFDAAMDNPSYELKAAIARLYMEGGLELDRNPSYAGDLYTEAAEEAMGAMKGKTANKYYALAEEAYSAVEDD